jgi:hypothetical protein
VNSYTICRPVRLQLLVVVLLTFVGIGMAQTGYPVIDTKQDSCYDTLQVIAPPGPGQPFHGQDAQFNGKQPSYQDNGDSTVSDLVTGLEWVQARGSMTTIDSAIAGAAACRVGGHSDWRMPTIKELYSLIDFRGYCQTSASNSRPFIDTTFFEFRYGDTTIGRLIDCQDWSGTRYAGLTMVVCTTYFGVNFADGRIKGYGTALPLPPFTPKRNYVRYVRGNAGYGINDFLDNGDSTITDRTTGLMWTKLDSRAGLNWQQALAWVELKNAANYCGHNDWRLPNAKELQSIVDYTRAPAAVNPAQRGPAIDTSVFRISSITNERGDADSPWFWAGTTFLDGPVLQYTAAVYVCFGRATGWMMIPGNSYYSLLDVHGAGSQRSDPKRGSPKDFYLGLDSLGDSVFGRGPQGDCIHIENYVRLVRDAGAGVGSGRSSLALPNGMALASTPSLLTSAAVISYRIPFDASVRLTACNTLGQTVKTLAAGRQPAGTHQALWDGTNPDGVRVSRGVYLLRLQADGLQALSRITIMR